MSSMKISIDSDVRISQTTPPPVRERPKFQNNPLSICWTSFVDIVSYVVCKVLLLARALGLKAEHAAARPSARATIGYLVYNIVCCKICDRKSESANFIKYASLMFAFLICATLKISHN